MCFKNLFKIKKMENVVMTHREVKHILLTKLEEKLVEHPVIILSDTNYTCINKKDLKKIHRDSGLVRKTYKPEVFDCDDFAVDMKSIMDNAARLTSGIVAPYAHGIVYGNIPTPHAINWFITSNKELLFLEPQSGETFMPKGECLVFLYT